MSKKKSTPKLVIDRKEYDLPVDVAYDIVDKHINDPVLKVKSFIIDIFHVESSNWAEFNFKDCHKPYFVICSWGCSYTGSFATREEVLLTAQEKLDNSYDDSFDITVFDVAAGTDKSLSIKDIDLK